VKRAEISHTRKDKKRRNDLKSVLLAFLHDGEHNSRFSANNEARTKIQKNKHKQVPLKRELCARQILQYDKRGRKVKRNSKPILIKENTNKSLLKENSVIVKFFDRIFLLLYFSFQIVKLRNQFVLKRAQRRSRVCSSSSPIRQKRKKGKNDKPILINESANKCHLKENSVNVKFFGAAKKNFVAVVFHSPFKER
jgi:hypothetical protein